MSATANFSKDLQEKNNKIETLPQITDRVELAREALFKLSKNELNKLLAEKDALNNGTASDPLTTNNPVSNGVPATATVVDSVPVVNSVSVDTPVANGTVPVNIKSTNFKKFLKDEKNPDLNKCMIKGLIESTRGKALINLGSTSITIDHVTRVYLYYIDEILVNMTFELIDGQFFDILNRRYVSSTETECFQMQNNEGEAIDINKMKDHFKENSDYKVVYRAAASYLADLTKIDKKAKDVEKRNATCSKFTSDPLSPCLIDFRELEICLKLRPLTAKKIIYQKSGLFGADKRTIRLEHININPDDNSILEFLKRLNEERFFDVPQEKSTDFDLNRYVYFKVKNKQDSNSKFEVLELPFTIQRDEDRFYDFEDFKVKIKEYVAAMTKTFDKMAGGANKKLIKRRVTNKKNIIMNLSRASKRHRVQQRKFTKIIRKNV